MNCECLRSGHKYNYLRTDLDTDDRVKKFYDVFFCEKCLQYRRILKLEQWYNGDGRWIDHPQIQYAN